MMIRSRDHTSDVLIVPRVRLVIDDVKGGMECSQDLECCSLFLIIQGIGTLDLEHYFERK